MVKMRTGTFLMWTGAIIFAIISWTTITVEYPIFICYVGTSALLIIEAGVLMNYKGET